MATPSDLLAELSEPSRRSIVEHLRGGRKNVSQLVLLTGLKQPNVSNHLARLREEGLVISEKRGREVMYHLSPGTSASLDRISSSVIDEATVSEVDPSRLAGWSDRYFAAIMDGDSNSASAIVKEALAGRTSYIDICVGIFQPALYRVGDWYTKGRITEADEHFATALTDRLLVMVSNSYVKRASTGKLAVLGAVQGNRHSLGLRMAADLLEIAGYSVRFLGADVPIEGFLKMVKDETPDLTLISCATEPDVEVAIDLCLRIRKSGLQTELLVGGIAARAHAARLAPHSTKVCKSLTDLAAYLQ